MMSRPRPPLTFSIVSHGQGALIARLLDDIARLPLPQFDIVLTLNIPEPEDFIVHHPRLPMRVIRNSTPRGFGANHNAAFRSSSTSHFAVLNPDLRLRTFEIEPLLQVLEDPAIGLCAPAVYNSAGALEDSARRFPTLCRLLLRKAGARTMDYSLANTPLSVDWVAGMFMLFRSEVFERVNGFDERYFMYFEDVDICSRVRSSGWDVVIHPGVRIIHDAQRASRRNWRHMRWHVSSAFRYLTGN